MDCLHYGLQGRGVDDPVGLMLLWLLLGPLALTTFALMGETALVSFATSTWGRPELACHPSRIRLGLPLLAVFLASVAVQVRLVDVPVVLPGDWTHRSWVHPGALHPVRLVDLTADAGLPGPVTPDWCALVDLDLVLLLDLDAVVVPESSRLPLQAAVTVDAHVTWIGALLLPSYSLGEVVSVVIGVGCERAVRAGGLALLVALAARGVELCSLTCEPSKKPIERLVGLADVAVELVEWRLEFRW